jgi:hypothetical protein
MEFTQDESIYTFNCVSMRGIGLEQELQEVKKKIDSKPSVFLESIPTLKGILDALVTGYEVQLKLLSETGLEDCKGVFREALKKRLKGAVSYQFDINEVLKIIDQNLDE